MPLGSNWAGDDHPTWASGRYEHIGLHTQVMAQEAAERAWYYRRAPYLSLEPDTRRCRCHGIIMFPAFTLTPQQRGIRHPTSPNILLHEPLDGWPQPGIHSW